MARVLDVGNCEPDHAAIRHMLAREFRAEVTQAHGLEDALAFLRRGGYDLVLVNRKLDRDYSDGLEIIQHVKATAEFQSVPCMLVTNYDDHQQAAVAAGAEYGFGKKSLYAAETRARLARFLAAPSEQPTERKGADHANL